MRILYSAVGDTDPARGCYDGALLHIVRHYHPDKVILFLSQEMVKRERFNQRYSAVIKSVAPDIEIEKLETDLINVHRIDELIPLVDEFYRIRESYPDDEILLNLSSGTPQMKEIMSYLAVEHDLKGIQVDSPQGASNRSEFALQGNEKVADIIESNLDNEPGAPNRCHEPKLAYLKRNQLKQQLIHALQSYQYDDAQGLFNAYKNTIPGTVADGYDVLAVLKHASQRLKLHYDNALQACRRFDKLSLESVYSDKTVRELDEFLMVMEVRLKQKQVEDFILKVTPFMYSLIRKYMTDIFGVRWCDVEVKVAKDYYKVSIKAFKALYPDLYRSWNIKFCNQDLIDLSLDHMLKMMRNQQEVPKAVFTQIEQIRKIEQKIRNKLAHKMIIFTEHDICTKVGIQSLHHFYQQLKSLFQIIINISNDNVRNKLIYDAINESIIEKLQ